MAGYKWVSHSADYSTLETAVVGGRDSDGSDLHVGRAYHKDELIPGKVKLDQTMAYVGRDGKEHAKPEYEVLCQGEYGWEFCSNGSVPEQAVIAGHTASGEPLYVGRVLYNGAQTVGKVQPSHGCLYIPFDGEELSFPDYEVLVAN